MRVIIRCAGEGTRWGDYLGVPKHLAPICGEPVLNRTVRLISEIAPDVDVKVVVKDLSDRRYLIPGATRTKDKPDPANGDLDKIASSRHLWASDRTVLVWGDIWWTRQALTDVLTRDLDTWHAWLRYGPDGHGGELFAFAWPGVCNAEVGGGLDRALAAHREGLLRTAGYLACSLQGGWALIRSLSGCPWDRHGPYPQATEVSDWTDDMDGPRDWDDWCFRWSTSPDLREEMTR